jgi:hypothetical protein
MTTIFNAYITSALVIISSVLLALFILLINDSTGASIYAQSSIGLIGSNHGLPTNQVKGIINGTNIYSTMPEPEKKGTVNVTNLSQSSNNTSVPSSEQKLRVIPNPSIVSPEELAKLKEKAAEPHPNTAPTNTINPSKANSSLSNKSNTVNPK